MTPTMMKKRGTKRAGKEEGREEFLAIMEVDKSPIFYDDVL